MAVTGDAQHLVARHTLARRKDPINRTADHHLHQIGLGDIADPAAADQRAVAKHRVAVTDAEDLVELVADEQDRPALRLQPRDQGEKLGYLVMRQRRGRLIHDHHAGIDRQRPGDGDQMAAGDAEIAKPGARVDTGADTVQQVLRPRLAGAPVDQAEAAARGMAEKDVLGDAEIIEKHGFLMDRRHPGGGGGMGIGKAAGAAVDLDRAGIGLVDAGQDLDDGRLARPVLADQRHHLAGAQIKRHIEERLHPRKGLGDAVQAQDGWAQIGRG